MSFNHLSQEEEQWASDALKGLSLEQKVGQIFCSMMMNSLSMEEQIDEYALRIRHEAQTYYPGGYYLNRCYLPTTSVLLNRLQDIANIPLLICADMEAGAGGGLGGVIAPGLTVFPPAMGVGAAGSEQYAYQVGYCTAWQARTIGVNFIFAPSLDVNSNPDNPIINVRSFGEDPELVSRLGAAYIRGVQDGGAAASAKHFPGHGDASVDSHIQLSVVTGGRERIDRVELPPFRRAIQEAGVYSIMTAHVAVPALEPDAQCPATLSKIILQDLLRDEMGYDGLIVTDALLMGGITRHFSPGEAAVRAFQAGADWLLMSPDFAAAHQAVLSAVQSGVISMERLDESVRRVLAVKAKIGLHHHERVYHESLQNLEEINEYPTRISMAVCDDAVTLVQNEGDLLPLSGREKISVLMLSDSKDEFYDDGYAFFYEVQSRCQDAVETLSVSPDASDSLLEAARRVVDRSDVVLIGLVVNVVPEKGSVELPDKFAPLIEYAVGAEKSVVIISFGNPYLLRRFPTVKAYICAYGYFDLMAASTAQILFGERIPHGKLPVQIPGICEAGAGLSF
ncbi:MAG: glycoside hydrolase family 3 C-terminal domain-containing protein [Candidatus Omnitrophica bacterium]|nr:glycoside hydrolase family 3 C-terminal domain-containing protein [Candidatus Omnitrophota bacterium]